MAMKHPGLLRSLPSTLTGSWVLLQEVRDGAKGDSQSFLSLVVDSFAMACYCRTLRFPFHPSALHGTQRPWLWQLRQSRVFHDK